MNQPGAAMKYGKFFGRVSLVLGLMLGGTAWSAIPTEPELRVETGAHLAQITRVSSDEAGRWIVTSSDDKTARLWDAQTGKLISVLRPPIGPETLGNLYAAALSPDGKSVALGGFSAFDGTAHALYLFDRVSGRIPPKSTLLGLEAPITQLAWSKDNQLIAVGLRQQGIRVFKRSLEPVQIDSEYNEAAYGADFARDGRLATASLDGAVRLYGGVKGKFQRLARKVLPNLPYSVAFSPDGTLVAVGYQNAARVDILNSNSLDVLYSAQVRGAGNLAKVAWSADGRTLFAGGTATSGGRFPIYAFDNSGRGSAREVATFANTVTSLVTSGSGVVAASAEPSWTTIDASGGVKVSARSQVGDFRDAGDSFQVADDGHAVSFPMAAGGRDVVTFDMSRGEVKAGPAGLKSAKTPGWSGGPSDWRNSTSPRLSGQPLPLRQNEMSRSVALAASSGRFVLGTDWNLRAFDGSGRQLWENRTPGSAWAVNITNDGRWVIAGLGDGTIRWYRLDNGQEQMALFTHADKERWILWTKSGYYDTSIGGEGLVGWHVNRAFNQSADFFPVGRFRDRYYRPDILQKVLMTGDEGAAVRQAQAEAAALAASEAAAEAEAKAQAQAQAQQAKLAAAKKQPEPPPPPRQEKVASVTQILPPVIELQSDANLEASGKTVPIKFAVRSPDNAPATEVKIRVDGVIARRLDLRSQSKARGGDGSVQEVTVPIPDKKELDIVVVASNKNGKSEPTVIHVVRAAQAVGEPEVVTKFDTLYLVSAGVSKYPNLPAEAQLVYPSKDAADFANIFQRKASGLYKQAQIHLLADGQVTKANVLKELQWLKDKVGPNDVAILFLAGHGFLLDNKYYFASYDIAGLDKAKVPDSSVPGTAIQDLISNIKGRGVFFLDTCHSGFAVSSLKVNSDINGMLNEADDEKGVVVLSGAGGRQSALEDDKWQNGAFTYAIKEGILGGKADFAKDGRITPTLLHAWVSKKMMEMTKGEEKPPTPKLVGAIFNDPFIIIK